MTPNKEKVIKGLEIQLDDLQKYADSDEILTLTQEQAKEIVALLKEQEEQIKNRDESLEKARKEIKWLRGMLKEQEAVKPKINEYGEAFCECGENVGIIPNSKQLPSVRLKFCPECGKPILWESR